MHGPTQDLDDLAGRGTVTREAADRLEAAADAKQRPVVVGVPGVVLVALRVGHGECVVVVLTGVAHAEQSGGHRPSHGAARHGVRR